VAGFQEAPPGQDRFARIARPLRAAVLRLEQVAVATAGDVEGMPALAGVRALPPREGGAAAADRADEDRPYRSPFGRGKALVVVRSVPSLG
jgi:hypothetical protein